MKHSDLPELSGPPRVDMLHEAMRLTSGDRDKEYGPPFQNLSDCAALFTAYLDGRFRNTTTPITLTAEDVAWLNVLQKIARTFSGHPKLDTYIDAAAYAAIAGECALESRL
jgi:hypothetical protein